MINFGAEQLVPSDRKYLVLAQPVLLVIISAVGQNPGSG